jgi:hypothetical protein
MLILVQGLLSGAAASMNARRIAGLTLLALVLAGCDSCGDWVNPLRDESHACRQQPPR